MRGLQSGTKSGRDFFCGPLRHERRVPKARGGRLRGPLISSRQPQLTFSEAARNGRDSDTRAGRSLKQGTWRTRLIRNPGAVPSRLFSGSSPRCSSIPCSEFDFDRCDFAALVKSVFCH
ncbi:hypothetical protein Z043_108869 [Scleropages formosus]|uniref:Uncharacterized protein n=1 Tax=Scleropages formosus TaxID=113540 RepID=A0A0P7VAG6_SCLFO|nr:hypothetical protein Z043_108869 [Scleropages formosus]